MSAVSLPDHWENPAPGMSRYEFTDEHGYRVGPVIEARTAAEAREKVTGITGHAGRLNCTHLSDHHPAITGPDPIFFYGPDAVEP